MSPGPELPGSQECRQEMGCGLPGLCPLLFPGQVSFCPVKLLFAYLLNHQSLLQEFEDLFYFLYLLR
ncbi:hypothetical protein SAMN04488087_1159 [Rhodothermus profundi]|uniref:Uncharacterized protein n=1 Tax=Rhodothermus profundi TaxID=633813 RepID=A0A1M6SNL0_9BACT|nr:hypothetical protein SAMN04488087_1159 [Rhodothermus profundi]